MRTASWEHFGGHLDSDLGTGLSETDLHDFFTKQHRLSPEQAVYYLTQQLPALWPKSSHKALTVVKELFSGPMAAHRKANKGSFNPFKAFLSPMHLLVQSTYCREKVTKCLLRAFQDAYHTVCQHTIPAGPSF